MTWTLTLPPVKPLSLNERLHWAVKARRTRELRKATFWRAREARIPACERINVTLHYRPKVRRNADPENLTATQKPCIDGLVDAGVVPDDRQGMVTYSQPVIHAPDTDRMASLWLVVEET